MKIRTLIIAKRKISKIGTYGQNEIKILIIARRKIGTYGKTYLVKQKYHYS